MKPSEFVKKFLPFARQTEAKSGISAVFILAQAAIESAWGRVAPGNMFFGVKDTDGVNGNEQLLTTTEYSRRNDLKFPVILSVSPVILNGQRYFKYRVKDYFRRYDSPEGSFTDHAGFFSRNPRYRKALEVRSDPVLFAGAVARAGYATDPMYGDTLLKVIGMIRHEIETLQL